MNSNKLLIFTLILFSILMFFFSRYLDIMVEQNYRCGHPVEVTGYVIGFNAGKEDISCFVKFPFGITTEWNVGTCDYGKPVTRTYVDYNCD